MATGSSPLESVTIDSATMPTRRFGYPLQVKNFYSGDVQLFLEDKGLLEGSLIASSLVNHVINCYSATLPLIGTYKTS